MVSLKTFLDENVEVSAIKREMTIEKRKDAGSLLTNTGRKMFKRRRCHGYKMKKASKEDSMETEVDDQFEIESESAGSFEEKESESIFSSEETRKPGRDLDWLHVDCFDSPQAFNRSQIKTELDEVMRRKKLWRTSEALQERYVCKFFAKQAWKPCLRKYRVSH